MNEKKIKLLAMISIASIKLQVALGQQEKSKLMIDFYQKMCPIYERQLNRLIKMYQKMNENVNVLNEGKMWADVFVYEGKATIQVRVSDHASNLERICGGVSGNKMSMVAFKKLIENNVIENA